MKIKTILNFVRFLVVIFAIIFTYLASSKHQGNVYLYFLFSFLVNFFLVYSLNIKKLFFEIFFATLIWLGFWFKYTMSLVFLNGIIYDSGPLENITNIDNALIPSIVSIIAIFFTFLAREKFLNFKLKISKEISVSEKIFLKNKKIIMTIFVFLFLIIAYVNFHFNIYQKGFLYPHEISFLVVNFIKWMLLFGLTTLSSFFIYTELLRLNKLSNFTILIAFTEIFISYSSMLSRLLILVHSAIMFSIMKYWDYIKNKIIFFLVLLSLIFSMFLANNYFSNHFRINYAIDISAYEKDKKNYLIKKEKKKQLLDSKNYTKEDLKEFEVTSKPGRADTSLFLIINRWVGIDSMLAVVSSDKLSFDVFFKSLEEKKIIDKNTFYENTFNINYDDGKKVSFGEKRILKGNTLPGIITFVFYTGSYYFLFISMIVLTLVFCFLEILCLKISNKNMIFASFISFTVAFRLFNFGYAPADSYLYLLSILGSMILMYFLTNYKGHDLKIKK